MTSMDQKEIDITVELAQMELNDSEKVLLAKDLQEMLDYFAQMNEINVEGVEPTTHSLQKIMRTRKDQVAPFNSRDDILSQAPELESQMIVIPNVL